MTALLPVVGLMEEYEDMLISTCPARVKSLTTLGLAVLVVLAGALPAQAATVSYDDKVGDTSSRSDIKKVVVDHQGKKNRLTVKVRLTKVVYGVEFVTYLDTRRKNRGPEWKISGYADSEWGILKVKGWKDKGTPGPICGRMSYSKSTDVPVARVRIPTKCLKMRRSVRVSVAMNDPKNGADWVPRRKTFLPAV
ncbi:MAG: hypothetical protein ABI720_07855 [Actinomycetes bacterium]